MLQAATYRGQLELGDIKHFVIVIFDIEKIFHSWHPKFYFKSPNSPPIPQNPVLYFMGKYPQLASLASLGDFIWEFQAMHALTLILTASKP
jgi:hypothetical protein